MSLVETNKARVLEPEASAVTQRGLWTRIAAASVTTIVTLTIVGLAIGERAQARYFPELALDETRAPFILGGALLIGSLIALLYPHLHVSVGEDWALSAAKVAVPLGLLMFVAMHMYQAGYMLFPTTGWVLEGVYDSVAPMAAVMTLAALTRRSNRGVAQTQPVASLGPPLWQRFLVGAVVAAFGMMGIAGAIGDFMQARYTAEFEPASEPFEWLIAGWVLMGLCIAIIYPRLRLPTGAGWLRRSLPVAALIGLLTVLSTHVLQAGYIDISAFGWVVQGLHDSVTPMLVVLAIGWLANRKA